MNSSSVESWSVFPEFSSRVLLFHLLTNPNFEHLKFSGRTFLVAKEGRNVGRVGRVGIFTLVSMS